MTKRAAKKPLTDDDFEGQPNPIPPVEAWLDSDDLARVFGFHPDAGEWLAKAYRGLGETAATVEAILTGDRAAAFRSLPLASKLELNSPEAEAFPGWLRGPFENWYRRMSLRQRFHGTVGLLSDHLQSPTPYPDGIDPQPLSPMRMVRLRPTAANRELPAMTVKEMVGLLNCGESQIARIRNAAEVEPPKKKGHRFTVGETLDMLKAARSEGLLSAEQLVKLYDFIDELTNRQDG